MGSALEAYYTTTLAAAELRALAAQTRVDGQARFDSVARVLILLQARACQTSFEVRALLAAGFPGGAYGRYRTLHELAVIAILIAEHGPEHGHADLADQLPQPQPQPHRAVQACSAPPALRPPARMAADPRLDDEGTEERARPPDRPLRR